MTAYIFNFWYIIYQTLCKTKKTYKKRLENVSLSRCNWILFQNWLQDPTKFLTLLFVDQVWVRIKRNKRSRMLWDISLTSTTVNWPKSLQLSSMTTDTFTCTDLSHVIASKHILRNCILLKLLRQPVLFITSWTIWTHKWLNSLKSWSLTVATDQFFPTGLSIT